MNTYTGTLVARELNLPIPASPGFQSLLGLALRINKKRAHLLVSNVLGKHVPQSPTVIAQAAHTLVRQIENPQEAPVTLVKELEATIEQGIVKDFIPFAPKNKMTVFGYAETATGLGGLVAYYLGASYIHSTRYPHRETTYGSFDEEHSHATAHYITPSDQLILDEPERTIVLVDDELTTGRTVMNTIRLIESHAHHENYYIATLTDLRTIEAHENFKKFEKEMNVSVKVVALLATELAVPVTAMEEASRFIATLKQEEVSEVKALTQPSFIAGSTLKPLSLGYSWEELTELREEAKIIARKIKDNARGDTLVLGVEENMLYPFFVAYELELLGCQVKFSSSTQSPVIALNSPEYAIQTKVSYSVPDSDKLRYAYNVKNTETIITFSETKKQSIRHKEFFEMLSSETSNLLVIENNLTLYPKPLEGPMFGSYSPEDVQWLLKDISNVELEAPAEEREEAIQAGEAHYAESLPIEYMPTPEYQQLFLTSLEENKVKLAEAIAFVAEQIYALRNENPVVVSLARAGTPIGVLIKRYLKFAYSYEAPHYAVSIVRGKGIDSNALGYLASNYGAERIFFVDGWTGKGAITKELAEALKVYEETTGVSFDPSIAVLADPGSCVEVYGTREDFLIPSACLNSTVSGLVSRTVLNEQFIGTHDYHGAKYYRELAAADVSQLFVETIANVFTKDLAAHAQQAVASHVAEAPTWAGWAKVEEVSVTYGINSVNLVKPGVGETTRVLLRRVPWKVLIRPDARAALKHIIMLAEQRGVSIEEKEDLPYACIGLIHPQYTRGATGDDGKAV